MDRRHFLGAGAATLLAAAGGSLEAKIKGLSEAIPDEGLKIRFMGTGAASGIGKNGLGRRHSSILVDEKFIIDFTDDSLDMIPEGLHPDTIFYTHSHKDHFQASAAVKIGARRVYLNHTWYDMAAKAFKDAAKEAGAEMPEIIPTYPGTPVQMGDITVLPLLANHPTEYMMEESQIYLLEKGGVRLLYATDTAGIPGRSARIIGIDSHRKGYGITALIMEATMGVGHEDDFRLFCHSSIDTVARIVRVMQETGRLHMPAGQAVWITHMAKSLHKSGDVFPEPLKAASDGLEVIFRAPKE